MRVYDLDSQKTVMAMIHYPIKNITIWDITGHQPIKMVTLVPIAEYEQFMFSPNKDLYTLESTGELMCWTAQDGWQTCIQTEIEVHNYEDFVISVDNCVICTQSDTVVVHQKGTNFSYQLPFLICDVHVSHSSLIYCETYDGKLYCNDTLVIETPSESRLSTQFVLSVHKFFVFYNTHFECYDTITKTFLWTFPEGYSHFIDISPCGSMVCVFDLPNKIINTATGTIIKEQNIFGFHHTFSKILVDDTSESATRIIDLFCKSSFASLLWHTHSSFGLWKTIERKLLLA